MDWESWNKQECNILTTDLQTCSDCEDIEQCYQYQSWFTKIPHFIIDQMQKTVSPAAFRVFIYLNRRANFSEKHDHYGMCWVSYKEINKSTDISVNNMRTYMKELKDKKFITLVQSQRNSNTKFTTTNCFEIIWMKKLLRFKGMAQSQVA